MSLRHYAHIISRALHRPYYGLSEVHQQHEATNSGKSFFMKKPVLLIVHLFCSICLISAQDLQQKYDEQVATEDAIIETLYAVISGEKGEARNWELFRYLFKPDAQLIPSTRNSEGLFGTRYMSPEDYVKSAVDWFETTGFYEKELFRKSESFGNITHVFSTYESFRSKTDTEPFMRGINSIQLLNDGERWWIINIYWMQESESNPIPKAYLPKN